MKYNPKISEDMASLRGFTDIHPLQPEHTVKGCRGVLELCENYLCEITGMDAVSFAPAAGAHGEFTGLMLMKAYHESRGDYNRKKIIVPDSAHGTNPASAAMAGFGVINIPSGSDGCVDIEKLSAALGPDTAGLMLTNPNTLGLFERDILRITEMVHNAGGLSYYDGANLNAVLGVARPGDMGFDIVHLNLHKTFGTPHGGGGPGSGPVGCRGFLKEFLPGSGSKKSIGRVKAFYGNFLVVVKALVYIMMLGRDGLHDAAYNAVLNANYMMKRLGGKYTIPYNRGCMHEFVASLADLKKNTGVSALDIAKSMIDSGMHPPTMYFPLIVSEALMFEPTETETKETIDFACDVLLSLYDTAHENPEKLKASPTTTPVGRPDEARAARNPVLKYIEG
jgi:glycine dehydrogenase subunit 2